MKRIILLIFSLLVSSLTQAEADILGRVVGVSDGDTLTLLSDKKQIKVRLAEIDTPEKAQPYGQKSKQALSDLVFGKNVLAKVETKDRYGRTVAHIFVGDTDTWVNAELVKNGAAWVYRRYSNDKRLLVMEQEAKQAGRGLWSLPEAERMAPWEWRKKKRDGNSVKIEHAGEFSCGTKRYCKQMTSCEEARFYLSQCGLSRLDRDKDGVPCESLCSG